MLRTKKITWITGTLLVLFSHTAAQVRLVDDQDHTVMLITQDGKTGIGTTGEPAQSLHIDGDLRIRADAQDGRVLMGDDTGTAAWTALGGDVNGPAGDVKVTAIWNRPVSTAAPADGQTLVWDENVSLWEPAETSGQGSGDVLSVTPGTGLTVTQPDDIMTIDASATAPLWNAGSIAGFAIDTADPERDHLLQFAGGSWGFGDKKSDPQWNAAQVQGRPVSPAIPADGAFLQWDDGAWTAVNGADDPVWNAYRLAGSLVFDQSPQADQFLQWQATLRWEPKEIQGVTALQINGYPIGDTAPAAGNFLALSSGVFTPTFNVNEPYWNASALRGYPVSDQIPQQTSYMHWDGSVWLADMTKDDPVYNANRFIDRPIFNTVPQSGQFLRWDGAKFLPGQSIDSPAWNALKIRGAQVQAISPEFQATFKYMADGTWRPCGSGCDDGFLVNRNAGSILDNPVSAVPPTEGQLLKWDGTQWVPSDDLVMSMAADVQAQSSKLQDMSNRIIKLEEIYEITNR